jgi:hypothetical protein
MEIIILRVVFFVITIIAYGLIFDIAKTSREKEALQGTQMALSLMLESSNQQLSASYLFSIVLFILLLFYQLLYYKMMI